MGIETNDIRTDTISTDCENIDQLASMLEGNSVMSVSEMQIETEEGNTIVIEGTDDDGIEISKQ